MKKPKTTKKSKPKEQKPDFKSEVQQELQTFIEFIPAKRFARHLRWMMLEFLEYDGSVEAPYLQDLAGELGALFDLLDKIEKLQGGIEERE